MRGGEGGGNDISCGGESFEKICRIAKATNTLVKRRVMCDV